MYTDCPPQRIRLRQHRRERIVLALECGITARIAVLAIDARTVLCGGHKAEYISTLGIQPSLDAVIALLAELLIRHIRRFSFIVQPNISALVYVDIPLVQGSRAVPVVCVPLVFVVIGTAHALFIGIAVLDADRWVLDRPKFGLLHFSVGRDGMRALDLMLTGVRQLDIGIGIFH